MADKYMVVVFACHNGDPNAGVKNERTGAAVYWGNGDTEAETWADATRVSEGLNRGEILETLTPNAAVSGRGETKPGEKDGGCTASA